MKEWAICAILFAISWIVSLVFFAINLKIAIFLVDGLEGWLRTVL